MGVDASAIARVLGITTEYQDTRGGSVKYLPQRIAVIAQGATASAGYSLNKWTATSANAGGARYGYGSQIHLMLRELLPANGDGVGTIPIDVIPMNDASGGAAAVGSVTPSGTAAATQTYYARIGGVLSEPFTVAAGAVVPGTVVDAMVVAVGGVPHMPVTAADGTTDLDLTSKWEGTSANGITIQILNSDGEVLTSGTADANGVIFTIVAMASGAANPTVDTPLTKIGNVWNTMLVNGLDPEDETAMTAYATWGEGRWGTLYHKPAVVFTGWTGFGTPTVAEAIAISETRTTDRVNAQVVAPGSPNIPCVVAARHVARIAKVANNNPPTDYGAEQITGIVPGDDIDQWDYPNRDLALKGGSSTAEVVDNILTIGDTVTFYAPTGEEPPAYRYVVDIVRLQNIIYNISLIFAAKEWAGAPLIPDLQPTVRPNAKRPKDAKAVVAAMLDSLGLEAIISDPATSKAQIYCGINSQNPKRLDVVVPVTLSGNTNVKDVTLRFGFYFPVALAA